MPSFWSSTHKRALKRYVQATKVESNTIQKSNYHMHSSNRVTQVHCVWSIKCHQNNCFMWLFSYFSGWMLFPTTTRTWILASGKDSDPFLVHSSGDHYTPKPQLLYSQGYQQTTQLQHGCTSHVSPYPFSTHVQIPTNLHPVTEGSRCSDQALGSSPGVQCKRGRRDHMSVGGVKAMMRKTTETTDPS